MKDKYTITLGWVHANLKRQIEQYCWLNDIQCRFTHLDGFFFLSRTWGVEVEGDEAALLRLEQVIDAAVDGIRQGDAQRKGG